MRRCVGVLRGWKRRRRRRKVNWSSEETEEEDRVMGKKRIEARWEEWQNW